MRAFQLSSLGLIASQCGCMCEWIKGLKVPQLAHKHASFQQGMRDHDRLVIYKGLLFYQMPYPTRLAHRAIVACWQPSTHS